MESTEEVLLLQVPPEGVLLSVVVAPAHINSGPVTADGKAFTVSIIPWKVEAQTVVWVYVIIVVPKLTGVTIPVEEPTVATAGLLEVHTPPG